MTPPLISEGELSAKKTEVTINDSPIPMPVINLPIISIFMADAAHIIAGPVIRKIFDNTRVGFLPSLSDNGPPVKDPKMQPKIVRLTKNYQIS